jgi:hypothetical protein
MPPIASCLTEVQEPRQSVGHSPSIAKVIELPDDSSSTSTVIIASIRNETMLTDGNILPASLACEIRQSLKTQENL